MKYFLGVDVGNTKSLAVIADEQGNCLGHGLAGPGSWEAIDWDGAQRVLLRIVDEALGEAGLGRGDLAGAGYGYAGYDWPEDRPGHEVLIANAGLGHVPYALGNDTLVGLVAGAEQGWGVVVVGGTSNNCRGRDRFGREGRITGAGTRFGEYGGAAEIVGKTIQAITAEWTMRGPATALTGSFVALTGATDLGDLLAGLARDRYHLSPGAAPIVFRLAEEGDAVAQGIITWAGQELGGLAVGVIRQLDLADETFDVVLSGSLYRGGRLLTDPMRETITAVASGARLVRLDAPPVMGGVLLGMEQVGLDTVAVRPHLLASLNSLIGTGPRD